MTSVTVRLTAALADRYRIEREPGAGGMATVYLAEDLHPDDNHFVVVVPQSAGIPQSGNGSDATLRYLVTLNWFDELRRQLDAQRR